MLLRTFFFEVKLLTDPRIRIAAIGAPVRASHFQKGESTTSSTYQNMTSERSR
jgi:hypothetical protein